MSSLRILHHPHGPPTPSTPSVLAGSLDDPSKDKKDVHSDSLTHRSAWKMVLLEIDFLHVSEVKAPNTHTRNMVDSRNIAASEWLLLPAQHGAHQENALASQPKDGHSCEAKTWSHRTDERFTTNLDSLGFLDSSRS